MTHLVDHLADLTGLRDRDLLDVGLVGVLRELLDPQGLSVYRCVGETGRQHWFTRARLNAGDAAASSDPAWTDLHELPRLEDEPERHACLQRQQVLTQGSGPVTTLFPLSTDREAVGVLEVRSAGALAAEARRTVEGILRLYCNFQGLLDYSERDTLTGLLNRKTFDDAFLKALPPARSAGTDGRRSAGADQRHWLGVIDIDHFKRVNDNYGHLIGDEVLLLLARLMRSSFRFHDRLYRFGGEEFVVLMRCGSEADAAAAFERLRSNTERYGFPQVGRLTVSIGFTEVRPTDAPTGAFERADRAVYHVKGHGRNAIASHAALVSRGDVGDDAKIGDVELF